MKNIKNFNGNITFKNCDPLEGVKYPRGLVVMLLEHDNMISFLPEDSYIKEIWNDLYPDEKITKIEMIINDHPINNNWSDFRNDPFINGVIISDKNSKKKLIINYVYKHDDPFKLVAELYLSDDENEFIRIDEKGYRKEDVTNMLDLFGYSFINIYSSIRMRNTYSHMGNTYIRDGIYNDNKPFIHPFLTISKINF